MNKQTPKIEIEYDYWEIENCATHYGIKVSNGEARSLYDNVVTSKEFLKKPDIETYLCALDKYFKDMTV